MTCVEVDEPGSSVPLPPLEADTTAIWDGAEKPAWYWHIRRAQLAAHAWPRPDSYSLHEYLRALGQSVLKPGQLRTMACMTDFANSRGITSVDRATISREVGVSEWSVTQHWKRARELGLLASRRRYDSSSVHYLVQPGATACFLDESVQDKKAHIWSDSERAWWASIGTPTPLPPPWGAGMSPF